MTRTRATTLGWAIAIRQGTRRHFIGRYYGDPGMVTPPNLRGYHSAVLKTRCETRALLAKVRGPYGFPDARVVRVRVTVRECSK